MKSLNTTSELFARYTGIYWFDLVYTFGYNLYPVTATTVTADLSRPKVVFNLTNFFALPGIRTQPD